MASFPTNETVHLEHAEFRRRVDLYHALGLTPEEPSAYWFRLADLRLGIGLLAVFCVSTTVLLSGWAFLPAVIGWEPSAIVSNSMAPQVERGDIVVFREAGEEPLGAGAVIRFFGDNDRQATVHRVEGVDQTAGVYLTRGDANAGIDSDAVPFANAVGVGTLLVPLVGWPIVWLHEHNFMALIATVVGSSTILWLARGAISQAFASRGLEPLGPLTWHTFDDFPPEASNA